MEVPGSIPGEGVFIIVIGTTSPKQCDLLRRSTRRVEMTVTLLLNTTGLW